MFTISDSRTIETDAGGGYLAQTLIEQGYDVMARRIVADEVAAIRALVLDAVEGGEIDVLLTHRWHWCRAAGRHARRGCPLFSKRLPGFGEVFRQISYASMGPEAILSRADAGSSPVPWFLSFRGHRTPVTWRWTSSSALFWGMRFICCASRPDLSDRVRNVPKLRFWCLLMGGLSRDAAQFTNP